MGVSTIQEAIVDIKSGKMVILVDDEDRENEGDLCMAAEFVTPEAINFMARYGRGLICLTLTEENADKLRLMPMVRDNRSRFGTAFTVSIEAKQGVSTGISAADRATTIRTAVAGDAKPEDLVSPGHIFPIRAKRGGVLVRTGQTEGSVDLARLSGLKSAGVICEVMKDDGTMARMPDLEIVPLRGNLDTRIRKLETESLDGVILAAGLDVYEREPSVSAELIALDNAVLLPHVGSATRHSRTAMANLVVDNLLSWVDGKGPLTPTPETPWRR